LPLLPKSLLKQKNFLYIIKDLEKHINKTVIVKGFVDTIRDQKRMQFLVLRDHSGKAQLLHMKSKTENDPIASVISSLTAESSVVAKGVIVEAPQVKLGGLEM